MAAHVVNRLAQRRCCMLRLCCADLSTNLGELKWPSFRIANDEALLWHCLTRYTPVNFLHQHAKPRTAHGNPTLLNYGAGKGTHLKDLVNTHVLWFLQHTALI